MLVLFTLSQPYLGRAKRVTWCIPALSEAQHDRNYMSGLFLREFYGGKTVAVCDIGATSWLAGTELLDLWGLGTVDVTMAYRRGQFDADWAAKWCADRGVEIAVLHKFFVDVEWGSIPDGWVFVGAWEVQTVERPKAVYFYAVAPGSAEALAGRLAAWRDRLSPRVRLQLSDAIRTPALASGASLATRT